MKKLLLQILSTVLFTASISAADVELTRVSDLTSQYFIMAYSDNGTYMSPYWMRSNNQNVMSPGESAVICNGKDYYYLMKAQAVTYKGEQVYRISISNGLHELFPNGIGGSAYLTEFPGKVLASCTDVFLPTTAGHFCGQACGFPQQTILQSSADTNGAPCNLIHSNTNL